MRPLRLYLLLAFGWSWAVWIPIAALVGDLSALHYALVAVAAAGPSVAGLLCTAREEGRAGLRRLMASLLAWRLPARWYALALGGPLTVALLSVASYQLAVGDGIFSELEATTVLLVPVALVAAVFVGSLQEELGWRGYALPRLLDRWSAVPAALLVGVAWALWHLPLYAIVDGQERTPLWSSPGFVDT
ncbi:MAG: CPBP family glutamic-type intramembrane protease [Solirubrobacteraceae bacterium]